MKKIIFLVVLVGIFFTYLSLTNNKEKEKVVKEKIKNSYVYNDISNLYVNTVRKMDQEDTNKVINYVYKKEDKLNNADINEVEESITKNSDEKNEDDLNNILFKEDYDGEAKVEKVDNNLVADDKNNDKVLNEDTTEEAVDIIKSSDTTTKEIESSEDLNNEVKEDKTNEETLNKEEVEIHYLKNGFYEENGNTYYYENDNKVTGLKVIEGVNNYFSPSGKYLGISKVKVIDVSYYQKDINWDLFASDSDCYGVILRLGYYTTLDKKFERNLNELKRLNIPYGIYLFSYATSIEGARKEASFTNNMIDKYDVKPTLGIYYDLESWKTKSSSSDKITKNGYNYIAKGYVESVKNHINNNYNVGVYSGRWYAMNRLGKIAKSYVNWVAEYNNTLKYDGPYLMWQYTSKGRVSGIEGNVDISYLY